MCTPGHSCTALPDLSHHTQFRAFTIALLPTMVAPGALLHSSTLTFLTACSDKEQAPAGAHGCHGGPSLAPDSWKVWHDPVSEAHSEQG